MFSRLAWLRKNCMQVFHYLADLLKDTPLFEHELDETSKNETGAVYNDYDNNPMKLLLENDNDPFCFSQSSNLGPAKSVSIDTLVKEGKEHALLEVDQMEGLFYEDLSFDSYCHDINGPVTDRLYLEKVFKIATGDADAWKSLSISNKALEIFKMRMRNEWSGVDSVYDAWLLVNKDRRPAFDYDLFYSIYPNYDDLREKKRDELHPKTIENSTSSSSSESSAEDSNSDKEETDTETSSTESSDSSPIKSNVGTKNMMTFDEMQQKRTMEIPKFSDSEFEDNVNEDEDLFRSCESDEERRIKASLQAKMYSEENRFKVKRISTFVINISSDDEDE